MEEGGGVLVFATLIQSCFGSRSDEHRISPLHHRADGPGLATNAGISVRVRIRRCVASRGGGPSLSPSSNWRERPGAEGRFRVENAFGMFDYSHREGFDFFETA